jgi:hypothetical protein
MDPESGILKENPRHFWQGLLLETDTIIKSQETNYFMASSQAWAF